MQNDYEIVKNRRQEMSGRNNRGGKPNKGDKSSKGEKPALPPSSDSDDEKYLNYGRPTMKIGPSNAAELKKMRKDQESLQRKKKDGPTMKDVELLFHKMQKTRLFPGKIVYLVDANFFQIVESLNPDSKVPTLSNRRLKEAIDRGREYPFRYVSYRVWCFLRKAFAADIEVTKRVLRVDPPELEMELVEIKVAYGNSEVQSVHRPGSVASDVCTYRFSVFDPMSKLFDEVRKHVEFSRSARCCLYFYDGDEKVKEDGLIGPNIGKRRELYNMKRVPIPKSKPPKEKLLHSEVNVPVPPGFRNRGNTCYINSVLQMLFSVPDYTLQLLRLKERKAQVPIIVRGVASIGIKTMEFGGTLKMKEFIDFIYSELPLFERGYQYDAHEFFSFLLDDIHEQETRSGIHHQLLYGRLFNELGCPTCLFKKRISEEFNSIGVNIQSSRRVLYLPLDLQTTPIIIPSPPEVPHILLENGEEPLLPGTPLSQRSMAVEIIPATEDTATMIVCLFGIRGKPICYPIAVQVPLPIPDVNVLTDIVNQQIASIGIDNVALMIPNGLAFQQAFGCILPVVAGNTSFDDQEFRCPRSNFETPLPTVEQLVKAECCEFRLEEGNEWTCEECGDFIPPTKRLVFDHCPPNIVIHLNRFFRGPFEPKDPTKVILSPELPATLFGLPPNSPPYKLTAVVDHMGTLDSGHYVCKGKRAGKWYLFNDDYVAPLSPPFEPSEYAYLILYSRESSS